MAIDRVFLRCDKCGDSELFLLYTGNGSGLDVYPHEDPSRYADWLEKHREHHPDPYGDLKGVPGFSVTTESTSDEIIFETVPCDHPEWKPIDAGVFESSRGEVTRKECTVCGHKMTNIKRLVAREVFSPRRPTPS